MKIRHFLLSALVLAAVPAGAVTFNWPGTDHSPVDTRIYVWDGLTLEMDAGGQTLAKSPAGPEQRIRVSISPAEIVYTDPGTGATVGTSRYLGQTDIFGRNGHWRQYKAGNGMYDLVDTDANIRRVKKLPNGNYAVAILEDEDVKEQLGAIGDVTTYYVRSLWGGRKHPVVIMRPTRQVRTDETLIRIDFLGGGRSSQGGGTSSMGMPLFPGGGGFGGGGNASCTSCWGSKICQGCKGAGSVSFGYTPGRSECGLCHGTGICSFCGGTGFK